MISLGFIRFGDEKQFEISSHSSTSLGAWFACSRKHKVLEKCLYPIVKHHIVKKHEGLFVKCDFVFKDKAIERKTYNFVPDNFQSLPRYAKHPNQYPAYFSYFIIRQFLWCVYDSLDNERSNLTRLALMEKGLFCPICNRPIKIIKDKDGYTRYACSKKHSLGSRGQYLAERYAWHNGI